MKLIKASNYQPILIDEVGDKLGVGGEGAVYRVGNDCVAKIYHKQVTKRRAKIEAMLRNPPTDNMTAGHRSIAWPVEMLLAAERPAEFRGYLMQRVDTGTSLHQVSDYTSRLKKYPHYTSHELHVVALNIASAFQALHQKGYVIGDVNDRNVMINEQGLATLIDTDSFQVPKHGGNGFFRCGVGVAEFMPPELQQAKLSEVDRHEEHDRFGLGVLLFKLLMQGHHPFNGKESQGWTTAKRIQDGNFPFGQTQHPIAKPPMAPSLAVLAPELRDLFLACFERGAQEPSARPQAAEWRAALNRARSDLNKCQVNQSHRYTSHLSKCPWCEIRDQIRFENGDGLDYFPPSQGQLPLKVPGGVGQKRKVSQGSAQRAKPAGTVTSPITSSIQNTIRKSSAAASASTGNQSLPQSVGQTSPPSSSSSLGKLVGKALLYGLGAWLDHATKAQTSGGASYPSQPPQPQPEIQPGRWQFQLVSPIPQMAMGPIVLGGDLRLNASGSFIGSGLLYAMGQQMPCQLTGQWQYDPYAKLLAVQTIVNGTSPPSLDHLKLIGGANGRYQMIGATGLQFLLARLS